MIEIIPDDYRNDSEYDSCGNTTVAVLKVNSMSIPLCMECIEELNTSLETFNNTIFCYKCENFIKSESGWKYGGSCKKDRGIEPKDAGYINCVECMHTCKDAVLKTNQDT